MIAIPSLSVHILGITFQLYSRSRMSKVFALSGFPVNAESWCSCILRGHSSSSSGIWMPHLYHIHPSSSLHEAIVIFYSPMFVRTTSDIIPCSGFGRYALVVRSAIEGHCLTGGLSAVKYNCSSRFCGLRTTCLIFPNHSFPSRGRSPGLLVKASSCPFDPAGQLTI